MQWTEPYGYHCNQKYQNIKKKQEALGAIQIDPEKQIWFRTFLRKAERDFDWKWQRWSETISIWDSFCRSLKQLNSPIKILSAAKIVRPKYIAMKTFSRDVLITKEKLGIINWIQKKKKKNEITDQISIENGVCVCGFKSMQEKSPNFQIHKKNINYQLLKVILAQF